MSDPDNDGMFAIALLICGLIAVAIAAIALAR